MYKSCSICGKIHSTSYKCVRQVVYKDSEERKLRSTNKWKVKSLEIREKANFLCEVCRERGIYTYNNLEVHHITKLKEDKTGLLDNNNLICLCSSHHKEADEGILDKEYLRRIAMLREGVPPTQNKSGR